MGSEDHYKQTVHGGAGNNTAVAVDLWESDHAAVNSNGTYSTLLYGARAVEVIQQHPKDTPMFMYMAFQVD